MMYRCVAMYLTYINGPSHLHHERAWGKKKKNNPQYHPARTCNVSNLSSGLDMVERAGGRKKKKRGTDLLRLLVFRWVVVTACGTT